MGICYKCNKNILPDFKICPYCGADLNLNDVENVIEEVPAKGITIEFAYSSSQNFEFALNSAKKFDSFNQFGEGKKAIFRVSISKEELNELSELLENLKGWRNRKVYIDGKKEPWESIFNYTWCYNQRNKSYKPELYCFGYKNDYGISPWGCIQTRLFFNEYSDLFKYGKWINEKGDWQFDKEEIKHHILNDLHQYKFCPALNLDFIDQVLNAFPDVVNPNTDKNWKFDESYEEVEDCLKVKQTQFGEEEIVYMKGVIPKKIKAILNNINENLSKKFPINLLK